MLLIVIEAATRLMASLNSHAQLLHEEC